MTGTSPIASITGTVASALVQVTLQDGTEYLIELGDGSGELAVDIGVREREARPGETAGWRWLEPDGTASVSAKFAGRLLRNQRTAAPKLVALLDVECEHGVSGGQCGQCAAAGEEWRPA